MKIWVENYNEARLFVPPGPAIAIRVFDPGANPVKQEKATWEESYPEDFWDNSPKAPFPGDRYLTTFGYTFSDIDMDQPYPDDIRKRLRNDRKIHLFTANMADDLVMKFAEVYKQAEVLLTHCHAGASRSPAIAVALNDIFKLNAEWQGRADRLNGRVAGQDYIGNTFVYRLLCEAATRLDKWGD
jgi:hypothetical protein